jgi:anti-anti-sigma factor
MPASSPRHVKTRVDQGALVATLTDANLRGDHLANALRHELNAVVTQAAVLQVVLDFKAVATLSSEVFRPLLSLRRHLAEKGGRLILCNLAPGVAQAFNATRLISTNRSSTAAFEVQPDVESALASLAGASEE